MHIVAAIILDFLCSKELWLALLPVASALLGILLGNHLACKNQETQKRRKQYEACAKAIYVLRSRKQYLEEIHSGLAKSNELLEQGQIQLFPPKAILPESLSSIQWLDFVFLSGTKDEETIENLKILDSDYLSFISFKNHILNADTKRRITVAKDLAEQQLKDHSHCIERIQAVIKKRFSEFA